MQDKDVLITLHHFATPVARPVQLTAEAVKLLWEMLIAPERLQAAMGVAIETVVAGKVARPSSIPADFGSGGDPTTADEPSDG